MELGTVAKSRPLNENTMIIFKLPSQLATYLDNARSKGQTIGFVPTMGALHLGHISLVEASLQNTSITVCSIFINPTQFNDPGDFQKYPVTLEKDIELLESAGTHILFLPSVADIYPNGTGNLPHYDLGELENILEGKYRPDHFQGVCQVMHRLLGMVNAHHLYMGRKDYQQCMVVAKLIRITGMDILLHTCATLREARGLAMSSRNMRLNDEQREKAAIIYETLTRIKKDIKAGSVTGIRENALEMLEKEQLRVDYVEISDSATLEIIHHWDGSRPLTALIAAFSGEVRLIDNMEVSG